MIRGVVSAFDAHRGDGYIVTRSGEKYYFHCVAIADGSREIAPGIAVMGLRRVGHRGRDEVDAVTPVDSSG